jgi:hypothetical protein
MLWGSSYAAFPIILPFPLSSVQIFSTTPCSQMPSGHVLSLMSETKFHTYTKLQKKL